MSEQIERIGWLEIDLGQTQRVAGIGTALHCKYMYILYLVPFGGAELAPNITTFPFSLAFNDGMYPLELCIVDDCKPVRAGPYRDGNHGVP